MQNLKLQRKLTSRRRWLNYLQQMRLHTGGAVPPMVKEDLVAERSNESAPVVTTTVTSGTSVAASASLVVPAPLTHTELFTRSKGRNPLPTTTAITVAQVFSPQVITGDRELDAVLCLREVCDTTTDVHLLAKVTHAATTFTSSPKDLATRYSQYLIQQGAAPFVAVLQTFDFAEFPKLTASARVRITRNAQGVAVFKTVAQALQPTRAEEMLLATVTPIPLNENTSYYTDSELLLRFANSVNPPSLSAVLHELLYWQWLYHLRQAMCRTANMSRFSEDELAVVDERQSFLRIQLHTLPPQHKAEARKLARAIKKKTLGIDSDLQLKVVQHLLQWATQ